MIPSQDLVARGMRGELVPGTVEFETFIDRTARRPGGAESVARYRNPIEHLKDFDLAFAALSLRPGDRYLELGFGGGQLLERALQVAASAAGIDHSPDMLALASERNAKAIVAGRLQLVFGDVHRLPWRAGEFTCAAAVNMFFFVQRPSQFLAEVHRVLRPGGRLVIVTAPPSRAAARGPWGGALKTYTAAAMRDMLRTAGFAAATVKPLAKRQLSVARKDVVSAARRGR